MKRGDLVTIAVSGDYGKRRPALIVQADIFGALGSVTVLRLTSEIHDWPTFRITIEPTPENRLQTTSQVMIDKAMTVPRAKIGTIFGRLDDRIMLSVGRALVGFLGLDSVAE